MSQTPVSNRASRPYESRSDTCHAWEESKWVMKELNLSHAASLFDGNGFTGRREEHHPSIDAVRH
jgi:hypothetical protein